MVSRNSRLSENLKISKLSKEQDKSSNFHLFLRKRVNQHWVTLCNRVKPIEYLSKTSKIPSSKFSKLEYPSNTQSSNFWKFHFLTGINTAFTRVKKKPMQNLYTGVTFFKNGLQLVGPRGYFWDQISGSIFFVPKNFQRDFFRKIEGGFNFWWKWRKVKI